MRKIFIDAGAYDGDTVEWFKKHCASDDHEIYAFEANPELLSRLEHVKKDRFKNTTIEIIGKAVWVHNDGVELFIGGDPTGSTLLKNKESGQVDYAKPVRVPSIDFAEWIKSNFDYQDHIIVKMDIEGAEFTVIPDLIDSGAMLYIDELWVEMHPNKVRDYTTKQADELRERLKAIPNLVYKDWH